MTGRRRPVPRQLATLLAVMVSAQIACSQARPARTNADLRAGALARSNLLLITIDTLRADRVGAYGGGTLTPVIDRLAASGVRFTDFYVAQAVCSASRTALLTGCYPNRLGILGADDPAFHQPANVGMIARKPRGIRLTPTSRYIRDKLFPKGR